MPPLAHMHKVLAETATRQLLGYIDLDSPVAQAGWNTKAAGSVWADWSAVNIRYAFADSLQWRAHTASIFDPYQES